MGRVPHLHRNNGEYGRGFHLHCGIDEEYVCSRHYLRRIKYMKKHPWSYDKKEYAKVVKSRNKRREGAKAFMRLGERSKP